MSLSILNNISSLAAENQLNQTSSALQKTLEQLSSGSRINTGGDDAAGLAIADGLEANITALTQSGQNATDGLGVLQVADGALAQVTTLLNRAVTIATEAANGTVTSQQSAALNAEFTSIKAEIDRIGSDTTYNGNQVFSGNASNVYLTDGTSAGSSSIAITIGTLASSSIGFSSGLTSVSLTSDDLTSASNAQSALTDIDNAIANVAADRGTLGAAENRLQSASNVISSEVQNLTSAESSITSADMGQTVAQMSQYSILEQTGIAALQQSNAMEQNVLKLLQ
jgi:flagellin